MFLRFTTRKKNGKVHRYCMVVENRRVISGRVVQRPVLYLGEINDSQQAAWRKTIEIFEEGKPRSRTVALAKTPSGVQIRASKEQFARWAKPSGGWWRKECGVGPGKVGVAMGGWTCGALGHIDAIHGPLRDLPTQAAARRA